MIPISIDVMCCGLKILLLGVIRMPLIVGITVASVEFLACLGGLGLLGTLSGRSIRTL